MALAIPLALKQLLGLPVTPPSTGGTSSSPDTPQAVSKVFGPAVNPTDQAAAEAQDPTGASISLKSVPSTENLPTPKAMPALARAAGAKADSDAPSIATPNSPADVAGIQPSTPDSSQLPKLAPQGGSNPVPRALLRLMGITAADPKEGQLYNGPTTSDDKLKAGVGFVGRLGNALAAAAGTPEQQQLAEKRAEFGPELAQKDELARAQIKSLGDYRTGRLQNAADQIDVNQQKADQQNQQAAAKMRARGYVPDEENPGTFRSMSADEILADPVLSKKQDLAQAASIQKNAEAALAAAKQDALMNKDNPTLALKARQIEATLKMAQANLALRQHSLANQDANTAMREQEMLYNYGANTRGQTLDPSNAAPGMLMNGEQVVPYKQNTTFAPTANMRTMQQMAQTMPMHIQELRGLIDEADKKGYIGPVAGRVYQDFLAGKVGTTGDPEADLLLGQMRAADSLISSALLRTHFGGRGAQQAYDNFRGMLPSGGSKELLNGALNQFDSYVTGYSSAATPKTTGKGGAPSANTTPSPNAAAASGGSKLYLFPDGKKRSVAPNMVREAIADGARETQ